MSDETEIDLTEETESQTDTQTDPTGESDSISREEFEEMRNALKEAARKEREARKAAEKALRESQQKDETDTDKIAREAAEAATSVYKSHLVRAEARSQLLELGLNASPDRFLKMIDLDSVTVDDDGSIDGLEDQVKAIREDFPEVFKKKAVSLPDADSETRKNPAAPQAKSGAEKIAAFALGKK